MSAEWKERGEGSWRFSETPGYTVAISAIRSPADPDWKSKPHSLEASTSTEAFNRLVGWTTVGYHWSVVKMGGVVGAGDTKTLTEAKDKAESTLRESIGSKNERSRNLLARVW